MTSFQPAWAEIVADNRTPGIGELNPAFHPRRQRSESNGAQENRMVLKSDGARAGSRTLNLGIKRLLLRVSGRA
jgi:hypothetical protein